jgi:uncharacterized membrane protein
MDPQQMAAWNRILRVLLPVGFAIAVVGVVVGILGLMRDSRSLIGTGLSILVLGAMILACGRFMRSSVAKQGRGESEPQLPRAVLGAVGLLCLGAGALSLWKRHSEPDALAIAVSVMLFVCAVLMAVLAIRTRSRDGSR